MKRRFLSRPAAMAMLCVLTLAAGLCVHCEAFGEEVDYSLDPPPDVQAMEVRSDGVLAESYRYHRQGGAYGDAAPHTIAPPGGWYGYGFPVKTYRWGWFGAERYYPRVVWHRGYYGDCCRWAYRHGY